MPDGTTHATLAAPSAHTFSDLPVLTITDLARQRLLIGKAGESAVEPKHGNPQHIALDREIAFRTAALTMVPNTVAEVLVQVGYTMEILDQANADEFDRDETKETLRLALFALGSVMPVLGRESGINPDDLL